jgi:ribosomal protein L7/L12
MRKRVVLVSVLPEKKIMCIHIVRANRHMGLKECKDLVESAPCTIKDDLTLEEAKQIAEQFNGYATVLIEPGSW